MVTYNPWEFVKATHAYLSSLLVSHIHFFVSIFLRTIISKVKMVLGYAARDI